MSTPESLSPRPDEPTPKPSDADTSTELAVSRRAFLGTVGGASAAAAIVGGIVTVPAFVGAKSAQAHGADIGPQNGTQRRNAAFGGV